MFKSLTYKQKFYYLITGSIVFMIFMYFIAIEPTLALKSNYLNLKAGISNAQNAAQKIKNLEDKLNSYSFLLKASGDGIGNHEKIHEFISTYCAKNHLSFIEYPKLHTYNDNNYMIETNEADAEGGYIKLLKLLSEIENKMDYGKVVSVHFQSKTNLKTKTKKLILKIYIQHIINTSENEN